MNKEEQIIIDLMKKNKRLEKENKELIEEIEKTKNEKAFWHIKNDLKKERIDETIEKLESIRVFGLRSGKTLLSTLINESIDTLRGEDNENI